ncbi:hypothetical protein D3C73_1585280 [compost metagenome]
MVNRNAWIAPTKILKPCQTAINGIPKNPAMVMVEINTSPAKILAYKRIANVTGLAMVSSRFNGKKKK